MNIISLVYDHVFVDNSSDDCRYRSCSNHLLETAYQVVLFKLYTPARWLFKVFAVMPPLNTLKCSTCSCHQSAYLWCLLWFYQFLCHYLSFVPPSDHSANNIVCLFCLCISPPHMLQKKSKIRVQKIYITEKLVRKP